MLKGIVYFLMILFCGLLVSCESNISNKPSDIPKKWHEYDHHFKVQKESTVCFSWWRQFNDPTLEHLIQTGLKRNNNLQIALANIEAAKGEVKRVGLNWIPTADLLVGYSSFPYLGYPGVLAAIAPTYTINIIKQYFEYQKSKFELTGAENVKDTIRLTVIAGISANYFSYLAEMERLFLLTQIERALKEEVSIDKAAYEGGLYTDIDLAKVISSLDLIHAEKTTIRKNMVLHRNAIQYLMNKNPDQLHIQRKFSQLNNQHLVVGTLPLNVIENRPDMQLATNELRASNTGVYISSSGFLPSIQLSMARGDIATIPNGRKLGTPIYFNQALLDQPLVTLTTFGAWDKAKALKKASYYRYEDTLRKVLKEVDDDLAAHEYFNEHYVQTLHAKQQMNEAYRLSKQLYEKGIISYSTLLYEKIKLEKLKIKVNRSKLNELVSMVRLYQDLAVGYGCSEPVKPKSCSEPVEPKSCSRC